MKTLLSVLDLWATLVGIAVLSLTLAIGIAGIVAAFLIDNSREESSQGSSGYHHSSRKGD